MTEATPTMNIPGWGIEPPPAAVAQEAPSAPEAPDAPEGGETPASAPERGPNGQFKAKDAEPPAEEPDEQPDAPEDGDEPAAAADGKLPVGYAKRVAREKRKTEREKARADEVDERLETLRTMLAEARETKALREPEPGDFDTTKDYEAAKARWDRIAEVVGAEKRPSPSAAPDFDDALTELAEAVIEADADLWKEIAGDVDGKVKISQHMVIALADADDPAGALRALRDDPAEAERISNLSPARQMAAILALKPGKKAAAVAPGKRVTQADDPPGGVAPRSAPARDLGKADFATFEKLREADTPKERFGW